MTRIVNQQELYIRLNELLKAFEVIGPKNLPNKGIFYQPITKIEDLYPGDEFTIEPVKKFFLSPGELLFKGSFKDKTEVIEDMPLSEKKRIIIGVRPCEARGLALLDNIFDPKQPTKAGHKDSDYKDSAYISNRNRTVLVGFSCLKPDQSCFCTSMGGSPVDSRGMDALIFEGGKEFMIEIITDKGKDILGSLGREINEQERKAWEEDKEKRKDLYKKIKVPETLSSIFESDYWSKVSFPCLSCGICTYLCPTCHCFDLVDEKRKKLRCYDGCAFADFTLEASGVNPRPTKKERYRQRVYHKFDYFKKNFGENLCVGCGRCIRHCPVKIDIADIVDKAPI